jgi:AcrR family transcriptional regulator
MVENGSGNHYVWEEVMALTKKAERTKARLLASAKKLIGEKGFDQVSVEDITKDSGVAKGTFYHYFKCKEDVVGELSFQSCEATTERSIHYDGPVAERCFFYVTALCRDAAWAGVRLVRQWIRETMESEEEDSEAKSALYNIYNALMDICAVHQGEGPGELTKDAPVDTLAKLMMSHLFGALTIWCMMNGSFNLAEDSLDYMRIDIMNLLEPYTIKE